MPGMDASYFSLFSFSYAPVIRECFFVVAEFDAVVCDSFIYRYYI